MDSKRRNLASDNQSGVCPEAWNALVEANAADHTSSYAEDPITERAGKLMQELFETDCLPYFIFNGTAANALALSTLGRSFNEVICHESAHIETSECGAVPFYSGGMRLVTCSGDAGKIPRGEVDRILARAKGSHRSEAAALSVTQATEHGTVYQPAEVAELSALVKSKGLRVHMDGARFANAVASLACTPAEASWKSGVDVLCFGGTKNGMMMGEAVVFFDRSLAIEFDHRLLQGGQLASKSRFLACQWAAMVESGAWLRYAGHANAMAKRLEAGLRQIPGLKIELPVQSNAVFVDMPPALQTSLRSIGWRFFSFIGQRVVRLMCSWDTSEQDVDQFIRDVRDEI